MARRIIEIITCDLTHTGEAPAADQTLTFSAAGADSELDLCGACVTVFNDLFGSYARPVGRAGAAELTEPDEPPPPLLAPAQQPPPAPAPTHGDPPAAQALSEAPRAATQAAAFRTGAVQAARLAEAEAQAAALYDWQERRKRSKHLAEVRNWAKANGYTVADRGMVPKKIIAAYDDAQAKAARVQADELAERGRAAGAAERSRIEARLQIEADRRKIQELRQVRSWARAEGYDPGRGEGFRVPRETLAAWELAQAVELAEA